MTKHEIMIANSNSLSNIQDKTINLIVTSPPYPMIDIWDSVFIKQNKNIADYLAHHEALRAFNEMHNLLNKTWLECDRILSESGFICINIGDAVRTIGDKFQMFSNHTQIINFFSQMGYSVLPDIHWRKPSNAPNKFMGSGMYPAGAYVTYEHEYILIFRKGGKRIFKGDEKKKRQKSAYFWEERNIWFSDLWEIRGVSQNIKNIKNSKALRNRNASFPFEIPYRLINMYSSEGDTVLDPFMGFGTTIRACMVANRNSIGIEIDPVIANMAIESLNISLDDLNRVIEKRIENHLNFINGLSPEKKSECYTNIPYGFPVKTKQETVLKIDKISDISIQDNTILCYYEQ